MNHRKAQKTVSILKQKVNTNWFLNTFVLYITRLSRKYTALRGHLELQNNLVKS